jgi:hypothetical protein
MRFLHRLAAAAAFVLMLAPIASQAAPLGRASAPPWENQTPTALRQMTYEIFARHGRPFADPEWQQHFASQSWYKPDPAYRDDRLTDDDRLNLRGVIGQRLKLAKPGERIDRPLWQIERDVLSTSKAVDWRPLAWLGAVNGLCIIVFILWRKARIPALVGFIATSVFIYRGFDARATVKSDAEFDAAYVLQGAITDIDQKGNTTWLSLGDQAYAYRGRFPFRAGEIVTLSVSTSGAVLTINGNRAPMSPDDGAQAASLE